VLNEVIGADVQLENVVPTRKLPNKKALPTEARMGVGTDWGSVAANWLTAWERSGLSAVFGLVEVCTELIQLIDIPEFKAAWLQYCRYYSASDEEQKQLFGKAFKGNSLTVAHSRLTAYAANTENDKALAARAWKEFNKEWQGDKELRTVKVEGPEVLNPIEEAPWVSTNAASQWGLAAIQNLALISESLSE